MERLLLTLTILLIIVLSLNCSNSYGQEYYDGTNTPRQYYYNNLEGATVGNVATFMPGAGSTSSATASLYLKANSSLNNTKSYSTLASASTIGYLKWNFFGSAGTAANVSLGTASWEWEFDYKNTGAAPNDNGSGMVAGQDSWRYWLFANAYNNQTTYGMYITVSGTSLVFRVKYDAASNQYATYNTGLTIPANTDTYQIRIVRAAQNGIYHVFVLDRTTGVTTGTSLTNGTSGYVNVGTTQGNANMTTYNFSYLETTTSVADHFQFDNFNFYKQRVDYTPITSSANGITTAVYPGIVNAIPYGVNVNIRGDIFMGRFAISSTGNAQALFESGAIYKTTNSVLSVAGGSKISDVSVYNTGTSQLSLDNYNEYYYSSGGTDGSRTNVINYYLVAQGRNPFYGGYPTSSTYSVSNSDADTFHQFYGSGYFPYQWSTSSSSTTTTAGDVWDWRGVAGSNWTTGTNIWKKNLNTDISNSGPSVNTDIVRIGVIAYSGTQQPSVSSNTTIGSLTFGSATASTTLSIGNTLNVAGDVTVNQSTTVQLTGGTLNIGGNFNNGAASTFAALSSTVSFTSGSARTITNSNTSAPPSVTFMNLNFTGGGTTTFAAGGYYSVSPTGIMKVTNSSTVSIPSATTHLQFLANSGVAYAQIDQITGSIQGAIDYQVYFTGGSLAYRNYRSMASPVYNNTTTYNASNGSFSLSSLKNTSLPNNSFIITGANGSVNGFDKSTNNGNTLKTYNSTTNNYTAVSSLNTSPAVVSGTGFYMYFRGNRGTAGTVTSADPFGSKTNKSNGNGAYAVPENVVYTYSGIPNQGNVPAATLPTGGVFFYFIANPYAATLDAGALISASNISPFIWTWDPVSAAYAVFDKNSVNASTHGAKQYVVPGQGFFIRNANTTGASKTVTLTEAMKSVGNNTNAVRLLSTGSPKIAAELPIIRLQFIKNSLIKDEVGIVLQPQAKDSLDVNDAPHLSGDYMNVTTITPDNNYLAIDKRPFYGSKIVIPIFINVAEDSIYTFKKTYLSPVMSNYKVTLYDSLLNNKVEITNIDYSFNVYRAKPETFGGKRFKLIIEQLPAPVTFFEFKGKLNADKKGLLTWQTNRYRLGTTYQVQRAPDTTNFTDIGLAQAGVDTTGKGSYQLVDSTIQQGNNYYRLVQTDVFGNKSYSNKVMLNLSSAVGPVDVKNGFKLYPNPVVTGFSILSDKSYTGKVSFRVYNSNSEIKISGSFTQLNAFESVKQDVSQLKIGVYFVELRDANNKVLTTLKFIKQ